MRGQVMRLAFAHVSQRSDGCTVGAAGAIVERARSGAPCRRQAAQVSFTASDRRCAVCGEDGLSVASVTGGFSSLADGVSAASGLAVAWDLGASEQTLTGAGSQNQRTQPHPHGGDPRFAVGQDGVKRGRRGYDAGKKVKGRKRHIAVDTQGNLLTAVVHSAAVQDRVGARAVLMRLFCRFHGIVKVFVDGGYAGSLVDWAKQMFDYAVEVVKRNEMHRFKILPKRWIVERTLAWLNWSRRLSKDYELLHTTSETMIWISFAHTLLRRSA